MYATAAPPVFSAVDVKAPASLGSGRSQLQPAGELSWSVRRGCANAPAGASAILQLEVQLSQKPKTPR
jgi:hypothetical protein